MTAGVLLRSIRRRRGLTQADLARAAGTSQPVISFYERDERDPSLSTLRRLVEAAGEQLVVDAKPVASDLPPPRNLAEHGRRLVDVLSLADAVPAGHRRERDGRDRSRVRQLDAPRLVSR